MKDRQSINRNTPERIEQARKVKVEFMNLHKLRLATAVINLRNALNFTQFDDGNLAFPNTPKIKIRHTKAING